MYNENRFDYISLNAPDIVKDNKSVYLDKVNELISEPGKYSSFILIFFIQRLSFINMQPLLNIV